MASIVWNSLYILYYMFFLSVIIVSLVFLQDEVKGHGHLLPNYNSQVFNFVYVGLWIIVGVEAFRFLVGVFAVGYLKFRENVSFPITSNSSSRRVRSRRR